MRARPSFVRPSLALAHQRDLSSDPCAVNRSRVTDLTFVPTRAGAATCFITDVFSRMIVGWRVTGAHAHLDSPELESGWLAGGPTSTTTPIYAAAPTPPRSSPRSLGPVLTQIGAVSSIGTVDN